MRRQSGGYRTLSSGGEKPNHCRRRRPSFDFGGPKFDFGGPEFNFGGPEFDFPPPEFSFAMPKFNLAMPEFNVGGPEFNFPLPKFDFPGAGSDARVIFLFCEGGVVKSRAGGADVRGGAEIDASVRCAVAGVTVTSAARAPGGSHARKEHAMSVVPESKVGKIIFYSDHAPVWSAAATTIGLTSVDATALSALLATAVAKQESQRSAYLLAEAATVEYDDAVRALGVKGSGLLKKIKATAAASATPGAVYAAAQIPPPAPPSPVGAPGQPTDFAVALNPDGSIRISWKCVNPAASGGTIYQVARRVGTGEFAMVGATGKKSFDDATVPAGVASVTYQVVAVRSTAIGTAAQFTVNFGVSTAGEAFAAIAPASPKLAA